MKKKLLMIVLALTLLLPAFSLAEARYPSLRGAVTDDANVLSRGISDDIAAFQTLAKSRTGVTIYVAVVHFLDGMDAKSYASSLFTRWGLGENDFLLLGAAGEDVFASASGKALKQNFNDSNAQSLLSTSGFSELFQTQNYDAAFGKYFVSFTDMLNKQYSADIRLGKLFSGYQAAVEITPAPSSDDKQGVSFASDMWGGLYQKFASSVRSYGEYSERKERESNGLTPGSWIVLVVLAVLIFGKKKPRHGDYRRSGNAGCGCSPLGWIFGLLGLGILRGRRR